MGLVCQVIWDTRETTPVHLAPSPARLTPPVYIGWENWPEQIYCIATHARPTSDAWRHAVEKLPMSIQGGIATWVSQETSTSPWETTLLSNCTEGHPFWRTDKRLMLALLALEATTCALQY